MKVSGWDQSDLFIHSCLNIIQVGKSVALEVPFHTLEKEKNVQGQVWQVRVVVVVELEFQSAEGMSGWAMQCGGLHYPCAAKMI